VGSPEARRREGQRREDRLIVIVSVGYLLVALAALAYVVLS
jgi:hypothetical protein